jgi:hypothetical protein
MESFAEEAYSVPFDVEHQPKQQQEQLQQQQLQQQPPELQPYPMYASAEAPYPRANQFEDNPPPYFPPQYQYGGNYNGMPPPQHNVVIISQPDTAMAIGRTYAFHIFWSCFTFWLCGWICGGVAFVLAGE